MDIDLICNINFIIGYLIGNQIRLQTNYNIDVDWLDEENQILYVKNANALKNKNILEVY